MNALAPVTGVILAGGLSSRMGGHFKGDLLIEELTLLEVVIKRFSPQVDRLLVNLNRKDVDADLGGLTVVSDSVKNHPGPLAGLVAAFDYLEAHQEDCGAVAVAPCDGPFVPENLVAVLAEACLAADAQAACVRYRGEIQPTFSLWRRSAGTAIGERLRTKGEGGFKGLFAELATVFVDWPESPIDPFFNINTSQDMTRAKAMLEG